MPDFNFTSPEGDNFTVTGPEGATKEQAFAILQQQIKGGLKADPILRGWDPHREEKFDVGAGQILPSIGRAGQAAPGSFVQGMQGMWDAMTHADKVLAHMKERGFTGIAEDLGTDLKEHYGSMDRARKTFETDPFRFLMDISAAFGGATTLAKLGTSVGAQVARKAVPTLAGRLSGAGTEALRTAGEAGAAGRGSVEGAEYLAGLKGQPRVTPAQAPVTGMPAAQAQPVQQAAQRVHQQMAPYHAAGEATRNVFPPNMAERLWGGGGAATLGGVAAGHLPAWLTSAAAPFAAPIAAAGVAGQSPRLMGKMMWDLGRMSAAQPSKRALGIAGGAVAGELTRDAIAKQAKEALKDKEFKKGKTTEQLNPVRKVARDPNADSKAMTAAQRVLGGYRPLKLTVTPEEGAYGGPDAGVPSRQEGGPVTAGKAYSVGDAPGATPDTPKPETFVPDRGPSPAQAAGAAATEGMGWISDAWASILKGEKPPPLPALPEAGKVPSTADPRPTQALGEETAAIAQLAGPPGAAAAKGLGAAALGAAAGKKLLKGAVEEAPRALTAAEKAAPLKDAPFPQYATEYPPIGEPVMTWDAKKGRYYPAKGESPEAAAFLKARDKIREQMKTEGYTPYFDPAKRVHADPEKYPARTVETLDIAPVRREALDKHLAALNAPEVRKRLRDAIKKGQNLGDTADWYAMGQLESEFTKEFGAKEGRTRFLDTFAAPMAATTGGMDPTGNLLLASYLNYLRAGGRSLPTESWQVPKGFGGGKYGVMPNIKQYQTKMEGGGYSAFGEENPKRLDFMRAFLGDRYHPVMDEQMTQGMTPGLSQPPPGTYGLYAKKAIEVGKEQGLNLTPDDVQAIAWAGFKDEAGKPMISHFNDAVERTYRLTGMPRQEIVRRWMRKEIPLYGGAGATIMAPEMAREATGDRQ